MHCSVWFKMFIGITNLYRYEIRAEKIRNAPLAKFRFLGDTEPVPEKPDPDYHFKRSEVRRHACPQSLLLDSVPNN